MKVEKYGTKHGTFYRLPEEYLVKVEACEECSKFYEIYKREFPYRDKSHVEAFRQVFSSYLEPQANYKTKAFNALQRAFDTILELDGFEDIEYRGSDTGFIKNSHRHFTPNISAVAMYANMRRFSHEFSGWRSKEHKKVWDLYCHDGVTLEEIGKRYYKGKRTNKPVSKTAIFYQMREYKDIMMSWGKKGFFESEPDDTMVRMQEPGVYDFEKEIIKAMDEERKKEGENYTYNQAEGFNYQDEEAVNKIIVSFDSQDNN